jgi:hypothetical protein
VAGAVLPPASAGADVFALELDANGRPRARATFGSEGDETSVHVAGDGTGTLYVSATSWPGDNAPPVLSVHQLVSQ